jgi:hypothetical protein
VVAAGSVGRDIVSSIYASKRYLEQEVMTPAGPGYPNMSAVYGAETFDLMF